MQTIALVLAAGQGTRMKSKKPKVIHDIMGIPMVELVIDAARQAGCNETIVITGHEAQQVEAVLPAGVHVVHQEQRIGTANAVMVAADKVAELTGNTGRVPQTDPNNGVLVVLSGDVPLLTASTIQQLVTTCVETNSAMTVLTAVLPDATGYGRIVRDEESGEVLRIVEHKDATTDELAIKEINTGIYCFALDNLFERLTLINNDNAQGEYYLTDILALLKAAGQRVTALAVENPDEVGGVNSRVQLAEATALMQERINRAHMVAGVTIVSPQTTWISPRVTIEPDVKILPNTHLMGTTYIASDAVIGPDTRIVSSDIGAGSVIDSSVVLESTIRANVSVGPRSYIRPKCTVEDGAKVGTSVEIKGAHIGKGSKVPHLSYVGDAEIGENCNLGAGTITCNYDGYHKSQTVIGDNVFIGSDTMLVAPVHIGTGAVVGAGSVITKDVPADALALERSEQITKEQWAARHRALHDSSAPTSQPTTNQPTKEASENNG